MSPSQSELSPRGAVLVGLITIVAGVVPVLGALGVLPLPLTAGTPPWVGVCAGMVFVLGGLAVINGSAVGGGAIDDSAAGAPSAPFRYAVQMLLGIAICLLFAFIAGWVGFGAGKREFSTSVSLPFITRTRAGSEWFGRAVFGFGAVCAGAMAVAFAVRAIRRLKRPGRPE